MITDAVSGGDAVEGVTVIVGETVVGAVVLVAGAAVIGAAVVDGNVVVTDSTGVLPSSLQPEATSTAHNIPPTHRNTKPPYVPLTRRTDPPDASLTRPGTFLPTVSETVRSIDLPEAATARRRECPPLLPPVIRSILPAFKSLSRKYDTT